MVIARLHSLWTSHYCYRTRILERIIQFRTTAQRMDFTLLYRTRIVERIIQFLPILPPPPLLTATLLFVGTPRSPHVLEVLEVLRGQDLASRKESVNI